MPTRHSRGILPRPRLELLIERIAEISLTVLKAPPGFGKSTLASAWAEAAKARGALVAWLTLDEADDNPDRLLGYLIAAVQYGFNGEKALLNDYALLSAEHLSTLLLNDIERRDQACFLFIDDYHCVSPETLSAVFDNLIRYAPGNLHMVFSGRGNLPPSLYAHLYSDACLEVDANQLRFELEEIHNLLLRTDPQRIDAAGLHDLHQSTTGWIAALRASMLAMRQRPGGSVQLPKSISVLFDEVLNHLPTALRELLPRLASVDKFNADLARHLTGSPDGQALIDELEHRQLFFGEMGESSEWYCFHPLFLEHLRRRLQPTELGNALRQAAQWFADQQLWGDAVRSALAADDNESAHEWITNCAMALVEQGNFMILLDWQRQLKNRLLQIPTQLKLALAWASGLAMTRNNSQYLLDEIEAELSSLGRLNEEDELYWEFQALRALLLAGNDKPEAAGQLANDCLAHLGIRPWIYNVMVNVECFSYLAACRWKELYSLPPLICEPLEHSRYLFSQTYRLSLMGFAEYLQGRFSQAATILDEALRLAAPSTSNNLTKGRSVLWALPASILARVRYQQGRLDEAFRLNLENFELIKLIGFLDCIASYYVTAIRLCIINDNYQGARHLLEEGERLAQTRQWPRLQAQMLLERIRISLLEHKQHEALACTQQLDKMLANQPPQPIDIPNDYQYFVNMAELWCEAAGLSWQANFPRAETLRQLAAKHNYQVTQLNLAGSLALAHWRRQLPGAAVAYLLEACNLVEHSGALRLLLDLPAIDCLQQLAVHALKQKSLSQVQREQLNRLLADATGTQAHVNHELMAPKLTSKELYVLKLVAGGKSNKEMAILLGITQETIKSHMKNIFKKLNVDSRTQAAVVANASGLI